MFHVDLATTLKRRNPPFLRMQYLYSRPSGRVIPLPTGIVACGAYKCFANNSCLKTMKRICRGFITPKVDVPSLPTYLNWTPIIDWYNMVWCDSRTDAKKTHVKKRLKLHAQNILIILGSRVNIIRRKPLRPPTNTRIFSLIINKITM